MTSMFWSDVVETLNRSVKSCGTKPLLQLDNFELSHKHEQSISHTVELIMTPLLETHLGQQILKFGDKFVWE